MGRRAGIGAVLVAAVVAVGCSEGNVFTLEPGTCFDDVAAFTTEDQGEEIGDVPIVDCAEPHDNEVFATFDLEGDAFPGDEAVATQAERGCIERFEGYVGRDYETSRFVATHLVPTEQSWDVRDDREVVCFLYDIDLAELEGSAQGSGE